MPTYTFTRTREQLARKVLAKLRALDPRETPTPEDATTVYEAMDLRLKEMHFLGVLWWNVAGATTDVALTGGVATATISAQDFLFPVSMNLRVGTDDSPIEIIGHLEYQAIQSKTSGGEPEKVFVSGSTCYFWPVPQSDYTAKLTYEAIASDTQTSTAPDLRVEAMRAFSVVVAADLVDDFHVPEERAGRLLAEAQAAWKTLKALNAQRVDSSTVEISSY
jgi:hypothetical protein